MGKKSKVSNGKSRAKRPSTGKRTVTVQQTPLGDGLERAVEMQQVVDLPESVPVLPAKDIVAFPSVMMSLYVSRPASVRAVDMAMERGQLIFIVVQKNQETDDPAVTDLFKVGVVGHIVRNLKLPDGRCKVLLQGITRVAVTNYRERNGFLEAKIEEIKYPGNYRVTAEDEVIINRIRANLQVLVEYEHLPEEMLLVTEELSDPGVLSDVIVAHYKLEPLKAQSLLEELHPGRRLQITDQIITDDLNQYLISEKIRDKARDEMSKGQREYYLREQIKQIQRELGESDSTSEETDSLRLALKKAKLPSAAKLEADRQMKRLQKMPPESGEYAVVRTYLEWLSDLPWDVKTTDRLDLDHAKSVLDEDHYGLDKIKDRILEYLSVRKLNRHSRGPILCFIGPPGVGKTSLGKSIARALERNFVRMSLGGVRDEAEIRGHRRTYIGALPGRVVQGLKQAGSRNPVFLLDELDKVGADFRGDPAAALLEVLDPAQNGDFQDHYLGVPFDLTDVMFIATANTLDTIPEALFDRLEVIYLSGYTTEEKIKIAERFLVPRQLKENGIGKRKIAFGADALEYLIERYTREAGVRNLEREIGSLFRKIARQFAETKKSPSKIDNALITKLLGTTKFDPELNEQTDLVGMVRGLAWTIHGGEVMPVEVSVAKGSGQLSLTGQLGNVMQESAQAALFYARANAQRLGLDLNFSSKHDIHIHLPSGATPKDGPSAGVTIATAIVSALSHRKVSKDFAMTGEITLRGNVLPVGGLKEKALAALRYGIRKVIMPFENIKDLEEIPKEQRDKITFIPVKHISEVLEIVLLRSAAAPGATRSRRRRRSKGISARV